MKQYVEIMNEIKNDNGRIAKENMLKKYENVPGLKEIFQFVFNPMIVTGLAKAKINKEVCLPTYTPLDNIFDAIAYVIINNTGSDQVVQSIQKFLQKLSTEEERELAKSILIKDLPIGLSRTTLNKVYGTDFINKYSVMLADKFEKQEKNLKGDFAVTLKLDGNRVTFFTFEDGVKVYTRSGKEVEGLIDLEKEFSWLPKNMVFDGEIIAENPDNLPSKDLFNITQTIVRKKGPKTGLNFFMFDWLPINEFNEGKSKDDYAYRMNAMDRLFDQAIPENSLIKKVPTYYIGNDKNMIPEILTQVEEQGYEGVMVNDLKGFYETKRTKSLLKVKTFYNIDLRCTGIKEDIRGGKCGSLTVDYKGYEVDAAGLKDHEKDLFWNNPELVVGKIIEVKYFEESKNKQGGISLRFPSFVMIRDDKDEVSYA